jgi:hypothetical protein
VIETCFFLVCLYAKSLNKAIKREKKVYQNVTLQMITFYVMGNLTKKPMDLGQEKLPEHKHSGPVRSLYDFGKYICRPALWGSSTDKGRRSAFDAALPWRKTALMMGEGSDWSVCGLEDARDLSGQMCPRVAVVMWFGLLTKLVLSTTSLGVSWT